MTKWSPIQSVIIRVITKLDTNAVGVWSVYHDYQLIIKIIISAKRRIARSWKKGKICIKRLTKVTNYLVFVTGWFKLQLWKWLAYWTIW